MISLVIFIFFYTWELHCQHMPILSFGWFQNDKDCVGLSSSVFKICGQRLVNVSYNLRSEVHCMESVVCSLQSAVYSLQMSDTDAMFNSSKSKFRENYPVFPIENLFLLARNTITFQHLHFIHFPSIACQDLAYERLKKGWFQAFSSKSGRGLLQEVRNMVIWLGNFWYFGKLVAYESWWNRTFDCMHVNKTAL